MKPTRVRTNIDAGTRVRPAEARSDTNDAWQHFRSVRAVHGGLPVLRRLDGEADRAGRRHGRMSAVGKEYVMLRKLVLTLSVIPFVLIVPLLEINATHVFNPLWPKHARLHEVWQLATNVALGTSCLWLAWWKSRVRAAASLGLLVTTGFLVAFALRTTYGGSMRHADGTELTVFGLNSSFLVMLFASVALAFLAWRPRSTVA